MQANLSLSLSLSRLKFLLPIFFLLTTISFITYQKPSQAVANDAFSWDSSTKVLTIQGDCTGLDIDNFVTNTASEVVEVRFSGNIQITTLLPNDSVFYYATNLERVTATAGTHVSFAASSSGFYPHVDQFFSGRSKLTSIEGLSTWDVSNVTGERCMVSMFSGCSSLTSLEALAGWDVSQVTGSSCMQAMFFGCSSLTSLDGLAGWDVSQVTGSSCMSMMFAGCTNLENIEALSSWKLAQVKTSSWALMSMFSNCPINYMAGVANDNEGFVPDSDMDISTLNSNTTWYPAESGVSSVDGSSLLSSWSSYAAQSSRWALSNGSSPYVSDQMSWNPSALPDTYSYTGSLIPYNPEVKAGGLTLEQGTDYRLSYLYTPADTLRADPVVVGGLQEPGTYDISVVPQGNYINAPANKAKVVVEGAITYTVTFDSQGGSSVNAQTVESGQTVTRPTDPTWENHTFTGWYTDSEATAVYEFSTPVTSNLTLYAGWKSDAPVPPTPESADWVWKDDGWRYYTEDGSYLNDGWQWVADDTYGAHWYYFYEDGFCAMRDWIWDNAWYYIQGDCTMACGTWNWIDGAWYGFNWDGTMCTGWVWDNSYDGWYYCYSNGVMARNTWVDRYWVDNTGRWIR